MLSPSYKEELVNCGVGSRQTKDTTLNVCIPASNLAVNYTYPVHPFIRGNLGLWWPQPTPQMASSPREERSGVGSSHSSPTMGVSSRQSGDRSTSPLGRSSTAQNRADSPDSRSSQSPPSSAIKFSIESILSRPDRVRKVEEEVDIDQGDSSSDILVNVNDCSSDDLKEEPREETSNSTKDCDENCHSSERYSWLQCTRYKPPKLPSKFIFMFMLMFNNFQLDYTRFWPSNGHVKEVIWVVEWIFQLTHLESPIGHNIGFHFVHVLSDNSILCIANFERLVAWFNLIHPCLSHKTWYLILRDFFYYIFV